jgi:hypothetical protein
VVRIIFHPSASRLAISGPLKAVMPHATLWARHALRMVWKACSTSGALLLVQVSPCAHEDRANARHRGNRIGVLQALGRFDHHDRQQVALGIERPHIGPPLVLRG